MCEVPMNFPGPFTPETGVGTPSPRLPEALLPGRITVFVTLLCHWLFSRMLHFLIWSESQSVSCSVMSNSLWTHGLQATSLLYPWKFPGKSPGVGSHFSRGSSQPKDRTPVSHIAGRFFIIWATWEAHFPAYGGIWMLPLYPNTDSFWHSIYT